MELVQEMFVSSFRRVFFLFFWGGVVLCLGKNMVFFCLEKKEGGWNICFYAAQVEKNGFDSGIGRNFLK